MRESKTGWHLLPSSTLAEARPLPTKAALSSEAQTEHLPIMTATYNLSSDLQEKKKALLGQLHSNANEERPILLIMGNEAGDTDSVASAVLACHLLSTSSKYADRFTKGTLFVPLVQQRRADLPLRAENQLLLDLLHVSADDLVFLDDLPDNKSLQRADLFLGLTDHPKLSASFWQPYTYFEERVQVVLDHHADDGAHKDAKLRILMGPENGAVGSAVSVVVSAFRDEEAVNNLPSSLADLALSALLIDTDNLRPVPRGKATETDEKAAKVLLQRSSVGQSAGASFVQSAIKLSGANGAEVHAVAVEELGGEGVTIEVAEQTREAASQFFEILVQKKLDVSRLGTRDLLRRDYKESVTELGDGSTTLRAGFSSVPVGLSDWIHQRHGDGDDRWTAYWQALRAWMSERKLDVAVIGTSFREVDESQTLEERAKNAKHRRELIMAYEGPTARARFSTLVQILQADQYASTVGNDPMQKLVLDAPWKGSRRVQSTGKRERVAGLDKDGRCGSETGTDMFVAVWRQQNARASRKV